MVRANRLLDQLRAYFLEACRHTDLNVRSYILKDMAGDFDELDRIMMSGGPEPDAWCHRKISMGTDGD